MKQCRKCNNPQVNSGLCRDHYNEYMRSYMLDRYHRRRADWVDRLGGECVKCGTTENLEFDHIDSEQKNKDIAKMIAGYSEIKLTAEMNLCQLLCETHHLEKSLREQDIENVPHGGGLTGKKNCLCDLCKPLKTQYMRDWRANH